MKANDYLRKPSSGPVSEYNQEKSIMLCAWAGCDNKGIISPHTHGGDFYCRVHASEVMGIDFTPNGSCKNVGDLMEKKHPGWRL